MIDYTKSRNWKVFKKDIFTGVIVSFPLGVACIFIENELQRVGIELDTLNICIDYVDEKFIVYNTFNGGKNPLYELYEVKS
jgi:hypothetical protein